MNIIIPMAGVGKRMRPHTLTTPKPLIPVAGKPIVQRIVEDLVKLSKEKIETIGYIIGDYDKEVTTSLLNIAKKVGAKGKTFYQAEALGPGHAVLCAEELLKNKVIIAFADTLFKADFELDTKKDGIIWVHEVDDPSPFGVVKLDEAGVINGMVEKPEKFVSNLAIIGIYYIKDGGSLRKELHHIIGNDIKEKGEFQLTTALDGLRTKGTKFVPGRVTDWMDCGNKNSTVLTNKRYLELVNGENLISDTVKKKNSVIIKPVFIGKNVELVNSVVGPYVSIGRDTIIKDSVVRNSIIQNGTKVSNANLENSMLGNFVTFEGTRTDVSIGDYNWLEL